jgi:hypothetical protein
VRVVERFDRWVERGPFTPADLGIYRIVYAVGALLIAPDITWLSHYPDFVFHAPPGPLRLLSGFPSPFVLIVLELLRSLALILLGLGLWTRYVSIAAALMLSVTYGLTYCVGKVDHTILLVLVPLVLAFANWGNRFSIDAYRREVAPPPQPQWPLRLLALLIAWAFFAAALSKLLTGWLSFSSQAARGYFVLSFLTEGRTYWLAEWVAAHDVRAAWEVVDWVTVAFELSLLIALPWWRSFRIAVAVATTFHLGVLLVMDIDFSFAVVAYGAFVSWGTVARRIGDLRICAPVVHLVEARRAQFGGAGAQVAVWLFAVALGGAAWFLMVSPAAKTPTGPVADMSIIVIGAAAGLSYLALEVRRALDKSARSSQGEGGDALRDVSSSEDPLAETNPSLPPRG